MFPRLLIASLACSLTACEYDPSPVPDAAVPVPPSEAELLAARPYLVELPADVDAGQGLPLLIALHGYGDLVPQFAAQLALADLANRRELVIAVPAGLRDSHGYAAWQPGPIHSPSWDVEYLSAIIHDLERKHSIDPRRVYVFGFSQGAHMAHRMGCDASADVVALASVAGQAYTAPSQCAPAALVSAVEIHGTEDQVIGYYGDAQHDPPDPNVPSAHQTIAVWARNDHCTGALTSAGITLDLSTATPGPETIVDAYQGCPAGIAVELWSMQEVGHWPAPQPDFMDNVLDFLFAHPRP
jgi:polyhydroxybutyrate depolymerase